MERLWFVSQQLGATSETWLLRQLERFKHFECTEITWADEREVTSQNQTIFMSEPASGLNDLGQRRWLHRLLRIFTGNFYGASSKEQRRFAKIAQENGKPDVILAHFGHAALRFLPIAQKIGCPIVVHFHGTDLSDSLKNNWWYRTSLHKSLSKFSAYVCVGNAQADTLLSLGIAPNRLHVIPCGVPTKQFERKTTPSDRTSGVKFATLSRLVKQKGIDICIKALAKVDSGHLVIMGDGPERSTLEQLAVDLGVIDRVTFTGTVSPDIAKKKLEESDVFLQHSLELNGSVEGFGVSVSEAAAMSLPVIVTATGGHLDQVIDGETGFLVPLDDPAVLINKMNLLASNPVLRRQMGSAGRKNVVAKFDTDQQVAKLEDVLHSTYQ